MKKLFVSGFISLFIFTGTGCTVLKATDEPTATETPKTDASADTSSKEKTAQVEETFIACQEPTSIPVVPSNAGGNFNIENATIDLRIGDVSSVIGETPCPSDACLVMTPYDLSKAGSPTGSDLTFFFDRSVSNISLTLCDASQALTAHGYVDTPGIQEDEVRTIDATEESACGNRVLSFDPPIHRLTIQGNDDDANLTWGVDDIVVSWSCESSS